MLSRLSMGSRISIRCLAAAGSIPMPYWGFGSRSESPDMEGAAVRQHS